jgi:hypothetical protein
VVESKADDVTRHVAGPRWKARSLGGFVAFAHRSLHDAAQRKEKNLE